MFFCNEFHQWHEERKCCGYYGYYNKKKLKPMKQKRDIKYKNIILATQFILFSIFAVFAWNIRFVGYKKILA